MADALKKDDWQDLQQRLTAAEREIAELRDREQRAINDRTNLQFLLYTTRDLSKIKVLQEMIPLVLERLYATFKEYSFALLIEAAARPTILEYMGFIGLTEEEKSLIVKNHHLITNDPKYSRESEDDIEFLSDDDDLNDDPDPNDESNYVVPPNEQVQLFNRRYHDEDLIYGGDSDAVTKMLNSGKANERWVILPGFIGEYDELKLFVRGYPIDTEKLSTIRLFLSLVSALIHNHLLQKRLAMMASTDALTGLLNRGGLDAALDQQMHMARDTSQFVFSIIAIDVNGLKYVNDTFGHEAGDALIQKVGEILQKSTRKTDIISRSGGDEFVVVCPDTDCSRTEAIINRIREFETTTTLTCKFPDSEKTEEVPVRVSLGVADSSEVPPEDVLREADHREAANKRKYYETHKRYR